jgi:hypothetical protein
MSHLHIKNGIHPFLLNGNGRVCLVLDEHGGKWPETLIVYNKGPLTIPDFLKQRRRIYAGHLQVREQQNYKASTMKVSPLARQLIACRNFTLSTPQQVMWTLGTVALEGFARMLGHYDYLHKREHHIWQMVDSTKNLEAGIYKVQHGCNSLSVIVFRFIPESAGGYEINFERKNVRQPR